jgi:hypothetical protein
MRAKAAVQGLISNYKNPVIDEGIKQEMTELVSFHARKAGMEKLPTI